MDFDNDFEALEFLRNHDVREIKNGVLEGPLFYLLGKDEKAAIRYLCEEWDFMYNGLT